MRIEFGSSQQRIGTVSKLLILVIASVILVAALSYVALRLRPDAKRNPHSKLTIRVYCAAGIAKPVEQVIKKYNQRFAAHVEIVRIGGSGELAGQIKTEFESGLVGGADLFITADDQLLAKAHSEGIIAERILLAEQKPVIAVSTKSTRVINDLQALVFDRDIKYGIASERAAVGKLIRRIAARDGLADELESNKATESENVMTLAQALLTGSLDAAVIWDTTVAQVNQANQLLDEPVLKTASVADPRNEFHSNIAIGVVATTRFPADCLRFSRFLSAPETGKPEFEPFGFSFVNGDKWEEVPEIHLYFGSMFTPVLEKAVGEFATREGVNIYARWEGCGKLVASMKSIEDADLFPDAYLACDVMFLDEVEDLFETPTNISKNQIVMAVRKDIELEIDRPSELLTTELRIGICDPDQSALGRLTRQLLGGESRDGIYDELKRKSAVTVDVGPTLISQILAGGLDVAFVYRSNVLSSAGSTEQIRIVDIGEAEGNTIAIQPWAVSKLTQNTALMERFFEWINRPETRSRFEEHGFELVDP